jgi:hypothetical protein
MGAPCSRRPIPIMIAVPSLVRTQSVFLGGGLEENISDIVIEGNIQENLEQKLVWSQLSLKFHG